MVGRTRVIGASPSMWRLTLLAGVALALVTNGLVLSAAPANADVRPQPSVVDAEILTPYQLTNQIKAAEALRADLMRSSAEVAAANSRLERLSAQANTLLANLSAARTGQDRPGPARPLPSPRLRPRGPTARSRP